MDQAHHRLIAQRIGSRLRRPWHGDYARGKLRFDPAYGAVATHVGHHDGGLLDIGCGLGLLGFYLRERGFRGEYLGIDFDAGKIDEARRVAAAHYPDLEFKVADAGELPPFQGNVALLDVLHYLDRTEQQSLLRAAAARVAPGAALIVRNVLRERTWRFHATVVEEFFLHASRWMRTPARHYPERDEIEAPLREAGLALEVRPLWGRTPFNSFVIVARREAAAAEPLPLAGLAATG
jgi:2-polyprenyl-3-methyl-5-hydroxy-6-metoxy-1,4-benzoquinol methylase